MAIMWFVNPARFFPSALFLSPAMKAVSIIANFQTDVEGYSASADVGVNNIPVWTDAAADAVVPVGVTFSTTSHAWLSLR